MNLSRNPTWPTVTFEALPATNNWLLFIGSKKLQVAHKLWIIPERSPSALISEFCQIDDDSKDNFELLIGKKKRKPRKPFSFASFLLHVAFTMHFFISPHFFWNSVILRRRLKSEQFDPLFIELHTKQTRSFLFSIDALVRCCFRSNNPSAKQTLQLIINKKNRNNWNYIWYFHCFYLLLVFSKAQRKLAFLRPIKTFLRSTK